MRRPRIGMVTQWFDPEGGSAAVAGVVARSLVRRGMDVDVLTGFPNYPDGEIYAGYRQRAYQREVMNGVTVHRVPLYPSHGPRAAGRIASYLSFGASSTVLGLPHLRGVDAFLVYSTPVTVGIGPSLLGLFGSRPVVTLVQDLWPETMTDSGILRGERSKGITNRLALAGSDWLYRRSDAIAVISPSMGKALVQRGMDPSRVHVVPNWLDDGATEMQSSADIDVLLPGGGDVFRIVYAGNLGESQSVRTIIEAAAILRHRPDIEFVIVGSGVLDRYLRATATTQGLTNVRFLGRRPNAEIPGIVSRCDAQLVTLADRRLFQMTTPSKIQYSLAFGRPIVAAVSGDPETVIRDSGAGFVTAPEDAADLAQSIAAMADLDPADRQRMGSAGRRFFDQAFSERVGGDRLHALLRDVIASRGKQGAGGRHE